MKKSFCLSKTDIFSDPACKATHNGKPGSYSPDDSGRSALRPQTQPLLPCILLVILLAILQNALADTASAATDEARRSFRIALMMDYDSKPNLDGRDNIMAALNDRAFQDSIGWYASFSYAQDAMYVIEPTPANLGQIDAAARSLMERRDIDLVMTFCTVAAKALIRHNNGRTPIFVASGEDSAEAGISQYLGKDGTRNLFISFPPDLTSHNIIQLKTHLKNSSMGVIYEDSADGELRARLNLIRKTCAEKNIQLYSVAVQDNSTASCEKAVATLAELNPDIFYAGNQKCLWGKHLQTIIKPMTDRGIPTIGESEDQARNGAMLSLILEPKVREKNDANFIISILSGGKVPAHNHKLSTDLILNLSVAANIGFNPSYALLATADKMLWDVGSDSDQGEQMADQTK